jgi:hypothetical protein
MQNKICLYCGSGGESCSHCGGPLPPEIKILTLDNYNKNSDILDGYEYIMGLVIFVTSILLFIRSL